MSSQSYGFSSSHVWMWELDYKESWVPKNWCFWTVPIHPKGDQSWVFIGRTDVEAETPILWPPDEKSQLIRNDPDAGKDWSQEEKGMTEDEMVGWHPWLDAHEFEQAPRDGEGEGGLVCCNPWSHKESDTTEWLIWSDLIWRAYLQIAVKKREAKSKGEKERYSIWMQSSKEYQEEITKPSSAINAKK